MRVYIFHIIDMDGDRAQYEVADKDKRAATRALKQHMNETFTISEVECLGTVAARRGVTLTKAVK